MNDEERHYRLARAKEVLHSIHHIPVSTVNQDGSPHASPVLFAFDNEMRGFWASSPESAHSQNILRDSRVFLAIFDSREGHSGLFLSGVATELADVTSIKHGLKLLSELKQMLYGDDMASIAEYIGGGRQRIYQFAPEHAWVNHSERQAGAIVRDQRYEIPVHELHAG